LEEHLNNHAGVTKSSSHLHSTRLAEVVLPAILLQQSTTIALDNEWVEMKLGIFK